LVPVTAGFAAAAAAISWLGFQGIHASYEAYRSLLPNIWPIGALSGLAALWVMVFAHLYERAELSAAAATWLETHYRLGLSVLAVVVALLIAGGVIALRAFPNSFDEYTYVFEARTFAAGRLWNALPPVPDVFSPNIGILIKDGKWLAWYPPGWPVIIAGVKSLGVPEYLASPAVALLLIFAFARLARELVGPSAALVGTVLFACCLFFVFNGASYFSHMPATLFSVLFVLCGVRFLETARILWALGAGAALGFLGIIRPYSAVLVAIPAAFELLRRGGLRQYRRLPWFLLGSLPFLAGFLFYNDTTTGNPWVPTEAWALPKVHMGLHPVDEYGNPYTLLDTSVSAIIRFVELAQWTSPLFCLLYAVAVLWKLGQRSLEFYDFVFPVFVLGFLLFFGHGGNRYGPRYYFEAYPFMVLTVISAATVWFPARPAASRQGAATAAIIGAMIMGLVSYPALAYQLRKVVNERMDVYDLAAESHLSNAIVVIRSETGTVRRMAPGELTQNRLTRDGIDLSQSVLYGLDQPTQYCALALAFPGRTLYRYERKDEIGAGVLRALHIDRC
jgi:hypothetical protein